MGRVRRVLFSVRNGGDTVFGNSDGNEIIFGAIRPSLSEGEVVLHRTSFVTMTFDLDLYGRLLRQQGRAFLQGRYVLGINVIFIQVEINVFKQFRFEDLPFNARCSLGDQTPFELFLGLLFPACSSWPALL